MTTIAFLGLGAMGSRMAARLSKAGHDLVVWNRTAAATEALVARGARAAASPGAAADGADFVISMVTDDAAARRVWLGPTDGALAGLAPNAVAIESSTVTPGWARELGQAVRARGGRFLDAPVAGSRPQAEAGQLVFMVGGEAEALDRARPVLASLSGKIVHVGEPGQGATLKLAVNAYFAAQLASIAELLGFLGRNGIEPNRAAGLLAEFPVMAPPLAGAARMMAAASTTPLFTIDLLAKDIGYLLDAAATSGADLPGAAGVSALLARAQSRGFGADNISGLARLFTP